MARGEFDTGILDRRLRWLLFGDRQRGPGVRDVPECVHLDPEAGSAPSGLPPVRIFLGTEPAQYRAERVFVWSVRRRRDPGRAYEIHLLKELRGFERGDWKTGFTRYRFAIPHFAGGRGRAIYNDVDQIYLADPALLFDTEMGDRAVLAIDRRETSVMLLDCEKLAPLWRIEDARTEKKKHFKRAAAGLWGELDRSWNARDREYEPGETRLFHFSTLHTQPWRPFPADLRYREHPDAEVWHALEREADAAGFTVFTREQRSRRGVARCEALRRGAPALAAPARPADATEADLRRILRDSGSKTLLSLACGGEPRAVFPAGDGEAVRAEVQDLCGDAAPLRREGALALGCLERLPEEDVPWAVRHLFACAERFVYAEVSCRPTGFPAGDGEDLHATVAPPEWWADWFRHLSVPFPGVRWELVCRNGARREARFSGQGGG